MEPLVAQIPEPEKEDFLAVAHKIGGRLMFPVGKGQTINQARGMSRAIADRFDLTLECIRLRYLGEDTPLVEALNRHWAFFELFVDFEGYTDFWLLQDLVSEDSSTVKSLMGVFDFTTSPLPQTVEMYKDYRRNTISFVEARNRRMSDYVDGLPPL
jgi:hypothetical protein